MHSVIRAGELQPNARGTVRFDGEPYGFSVSFFLVNNEPGAGLDLHKHPYSETWIVRAGTARITADGVDVVAGQHAVCARGGVHCQPRTKILPWARTARPRPLLCGRTRQGARGDTWGADPWLHYSVWTGRSP